MDITYKQVETIDEFIDAIRLRIEVFIKEQGGRPGWEPDEKDKIAVQFIGIQDGQIITTARVLEETPGTFRIARMVTKKEARNNGAASGLLNFLVNETKKHSPKKIWLQSQVQAQLFYEKCGFKTTSKPYDVWGGPHIDMELDKL